METQRTRFSLGQTLITPGAMEALHQEDVRSAMRRHSQGDWGNCSRDDREANDQALVDGGRMFSVYQDKFGTRFWIITEADRSSTTVLLPSEY